MRAVQIVCRLCMSALFILAYVKSEMHMTDEQKEMSKMLHDNCVKETGVNEDMITEVSNGHFKDDDKLKCYTKCLMEQMGVYNEDDSSIDKEAFIEMVPDDIKPSLSNVLDKCMPLSGDNACQKMYNLFECFYKHDPEKFFMV